MAHCISNPALPPSVIRKTTVKYNPGAIL